MTDKTIDKMINRTIERLMDEWMDDVRTDDVYYMSSLYLLYFYISYCVYCILFNCILHWTVFKTFTHHGTCAVADVTTRVI